MQTLYITKGLPASGKSTWAKEYCSKNQNTIRINRDDIREMLTPKFQHGSKMEELVTDIEDEGIKQALRSGYDVIVDATNFRNTEDRFRKILNQIYFENIAKLEIVDFTHIHVDECIKRDSEREKGRVGEEVIRKMHSKYLRNI